MKDEAGPRRRALTVGRERFRKISAVEGLALSYSAQAEFEEDEARGLTPAARRQRIIDKYAGD